MSSYRTLKESEIREHLAKLSGITRLEPHFTDSSLTGVTLHTEAGPTKIAFESYALKILVPKLETKYRATLTHNAGLLPTITQDFSDEHARDRFIDSLSYEITSQFAIAVSTFEVPA